MLNHNLKNSMMTTILKQREYRKGIMGCLVSGVQKLELLLHLEIE
jgi:hypothetical protein